MSQFSDVAIRFWDEVVSRHSGPLAFRFIMQPAMALLFAARDGYKDARAGRLPYLWTIVNDPAQRGTRLREGLQAVSRIILIGAVMDLIYQFTVLQGFHPLQLVVVVGILCFVPYLIARGPSRRIAFRLIHLRVRKPSHV